MLRSPRPFGRFANARFGATRFGLAARQRLRPVLWAILWLAGAGVCTLSLGLASVFLYLDPQIPSTDTYRHYQFETPLRIYTADGLLIGEFGNRRLIPIALADVPRHFLAGLVNTEDKRFYDHGGIDFISLANDFVGLFTSDVRTGASTLTMQLAKIVSFSHKQQFIRKFKEMLLAVKVERELSKEQILELYVNIMSFGKHAYGVQAAAFTYYGKPVGELGLAQLAMLAGIIKKPEAGNPINGPEWALKRRNLVLRRMLQQGAVADGEYQQAVAAPITARVFERGIDLPAPYPAEWVRQQLIERYGTDIYSGYVAHTTLDSELQAAAQRALRDGLVSYDRRHGYRGAERRVALPGLGDGSGVDTAALRELADSRIVGGLEPAVVVAVDEETAEVLRKSGDTVQLPWSGLRWRRHIDADTVGQAPQEAADVVAPGEVVRIERRDDSWRLAQLPDIQGALVALDADTGSVRAMVGGWDFHSNQFNHALQAKRQPGSGFKPFVYSAALENGVTPATIFWDSPLVFNDDNLETAYRPRNDSGDFRGPMPLRQAFYQSRNVVSMQVMMQVGHRSIIDHARRFGFDTSAMPRNTQLAIGGGTMTFTPLEMASAYAVLANGGFRVEPHVIERVERLDGAVAWQPAHPRVCRDCPAAGAAEPAPSEDAPVVAPPARRVIDERNAFVMNSLLQDVIKRGTGRRARVLNRVDIAGKTGTTDQATDTWFNGYHPNLAVSVWVGFDDLRPMGEREYGSTTPLPIWIDFMRGALAELPVVERLMPDDVVSVKVAPSTGRRASADDPDAVFEVFFADNLPTGSGRQASRPGAVDAVRPEDIF